MGGTEDRVVVFASLESGGGSEDRVVRVHNMVSLPRQFTRFEFYKCESTFKLF